MNKEQYLEYYYNHKIQHGYKWLSAAEILKRAADKILISYQNANRIFDLTQIEGYNIESNDYAAIREIQADMELIPAYILLMGYALENSIKGVILVDKWLNEPTFFEGKRFGELRLPRKEGRGFIYIKTHKLYSQFDAENVEITLDDNEKRQLLEVEKYVTWAGRYQFPKDPSTAETVFGVSFTNDQRPKIINTIYEKTVIELKKLSKLQTEIINKY